MTATLPGDIPGLLRRGSSVVVLVGRHAGRRAVVIAPHDVDGVAVTVDLPDVDLLRWYGAEEVALDLTDPTSRAHAAWWLCDQDWDDVEEAIREHAGSLDAAGLIEWWVSGRDCTPASIEALRLVVLHVAGRASR